LRVERERACDDLVLRAGANGPDYAHQLLQLARGTRGSGGPAWALAMARPSQLEGRLLSILDPTRERQGLSRGMTAATVVAVALLAVVLAGLQPWATPVSANTSLAFETLGADGLATEAQQPTPQPSAPVPPPQRRASEQPVVAPAPERAERGKPASAAVVAALSEAIHDTDAEVRRQAINTLGQMRAESAAPALASALKDSDGEVREQAARALGELRATSAVDALATALKDNDGEVRKQAAFALGEIHDPRAVPALTAALADS